MPGLLCYHGPAGLLAPVREALRWVTDPASGLDLLAAGRVRSVRVGGEGTLHVVLALRPGPLAQVMAEDLRDELFDHLRGWSDICIRIQPPGLPGLCSGVCRQERPGRALP